MKRWKRGLSAALALALSAGVLAGCGSKDGGVDATPNPAGTVEPGSSAVAAETEYVYVPSFFQVTGFGEDNSLNEAVWTGDSFVVSAYEMVADNTPEGVTPEYEGEYWEYGPVLYRIGLDGKAEKLPWQRPLEADSAEAEEPGEASGEAAGEPEPTEDAASENRDSRGVNLSGICAAPGGGLLLLEEEYHNWYDGPKNLSQEDDGYWNYWKYEQSYKLVTLDAQCQQVSELPLDGLAPDDGNDYFYVRSFTADAEGNFYLASDQTVYILSPEGELLGTVETEGYAQKLLALPDGVYAAYYGGRGLSVSRIDPKTAKLGPAAGLLADGGTLIAGGGDYDLYYSNGINFYGYSLETQESELVLNWMDCDINPDGNRSSVAVLPDGRVAVAFTDWDMETAEHPDNQLVVLEPKPWDSVPHKEVLTLATQGLGDDVRRMILSFNRGSGKYRIQVKDYSEYNNYYSDNEEDYTAGLTKLKTEIGAGNVPDLLDLSSMPMDQLAAKGILEDLYPYLDADPEIDRSDLMENVLGALEVNGGLYTTCSTFSIYTVVGASSVVGDTPGWTYDEFNAALASMPEGCTAFDSYVTRDDVLRYCLALDLDRFVNWSTGECSFDSEDFCQLLEFAKGFPSDFDWQNFDYEESPDRIAAGKQMLVATGVGDFQEQQMYRAMFGGDMTYIGFPTASGTGSMIMADGSAYAMSAKCANKEAAWEFLRQFFLPRTVSRYYGGYGLPIHKSSFEAALAEAMTPEYEKDENGNYLLDENGQRIEVSQGGWGWGSLTIEIYAMTEEEADQLRELIATTTKLYKQDDSIQKIITEQLPAFFDGEKTAQETARLIQSKAMLYVNEQR